jgi:hypothetical protein
MVPAAIGNLLLRLATLTAKMEERCGAKSAIAFGAHPSGLIIGAMLHRAKCYRIWTGENLTIEESDNDLKVSFHAQYP